MNWLELFDFCLVFDGVKDIKVFVGDRWLIIVNLFVFVINIKYNCVIICIYMDYKDFFICGNYSV